jgi:hypothetical protein
MPRANDKPFPCEECRFNWKGECRRNPPSAMPYPQFPTQAYKEGQIGVVASFPHATLGCFAGEPRVARSCGNCRKIAWLECPVARLYSWKRPDGWHCSEWERAE